jgi:signal transduction histidine kinase
VKLTTRIVVRALLVMAFALAGVSLLTYELVRVSGRADIDDLLRDEASQLTATLSDQAEAGTDADGVLSAADVEQAAQAALTVHPSGPRHVAAITVGGTRLQASGGPPPLASLLRGDDAPEPDPGRLRTTDTPIGPVRALDVAVTDDAGATVAVVSVLAPLDPSRYAASNALTRAAVAGVVALLVGGTVLTLVVRRSLRPLQELSTAARAITPEELSGRVPVPDSDDEVEELARELNEMLERIDADDRTRRRYLAAVSHEVRTPLTVAEGHLELLEQNQLDPAAAAATVRQELDRLRRVLDDLLAVARGEDEVEIRVGPVFLPDLFAAIGSRVGALGLADRVRIEPAPPAAFTGDQARIEQCVSNLVENAVDHNPPDTSVTIAATIDEDGVAIAVTDNGTGIDPELLPHVREPFVTSRPTGSRRASGLGLTVVDSLTRAQHGRLDLDTGSTGTTATLTYPLEPPVP